MSDDTVPKILDLMDALKDSLGIRRAPRVSSEEQETAPPIPGCYYETCTAEGECRHPSDCAAYRARVAVASEVPPEPLAPYLLCNHCGATTKNITAFAGERCFKCRGITWRLDDTAGWVCRDCGTPVPASVVLDMEARPAPTAPTPDEDPPFASVVEHMHPLPGLLDNYGAALARKDGWAAEITRDAINARVADLSSRLSEAERQNSEDAEHIAHMAVQLEESEELAARLMEMARAAVDRVELDPQTRIRKLRRALSGERPQHD